MNLKVDKEFQEKIPPLTEAEFAQLKENILSDGEVQPVFVSALVFDAWEYIKRCER